MIQWGREESYVIVGDAIARAVGRLLCRAGHHKLTIQHGPAGRGRIHYRACGRCRAHL